MKKKYSIRKCDGKRKSFKSGYLLVEISISIFIFSILVLVLSVFLKRGVIIEKVKKNSQLSDESVYNSQNRLTEDIRNRDRKEFLYNGENSDIFILENEILFKRENLFYRIELKNNRELLISDGERYENTGVKIKIGEYENIKFQKLDDILVIKSELNGKSYTKIVSLK